MTKMIKWTGLLAGLVSVLFIVAGCQQAAEIEAPDSNWIDFEVSSCIESEEITRSDEPDTKTVYSGRDELGDIVNSASRTERIDWVPNVDKITFLCQQATGDKTANYKIVAAEANGGSSTASLAEMDNKLYWNSEVDYHYFFGLYPSNYQNENASIATASNGTAAKISAVIPATQTVTMDGNELKPDMDYAYMYAVKKVSSGRVNMSFKPLMNAIRFTLTSASAFPTSLTLTKIELSKTASGNYLTGNFQATITENGLTPLTTSDVTNGGYKVTINVPNGTQLKTDQPLMFTFLTLPLKQSAMKLTLTFSDGSTKSLNLKSGGNDIVLNPCKKVYINDINLPWKYVFEVSPETISTNYLGTGNNYESYTVTSYKYLSGSGTKYGVRWDAISYSVNGGAATSTKPTWLPTFKASNTPSDGNPVSHNVKIAPSDRHNPGIEALENATALGTESSPYDLSRHNINGGSISKTTANCYVITAPGWYKFPLAYGNAYKNGSTNTDAYKHTQSSYNGHYLKNFTDANNNNISSPDISGIDGVQLVWQDAQGLVTVEDLKLDNGFIVFHIEKENIREGNAVIAARKGNTTFWSWHIWVTPYVKTDVTLKGQKYMARNLGWCEGGSTTWDARNVVITFRQKESLNTDVLKITQSGKTETVLGSSPHYQWGRKDPMIPPIGLSDATQYAANKIWYNASGVASQNVTVKKGPQKIGYGIQNPMTMIYDPREELPRGESGSGSSGSGHWYSDWTGNTGTWESNNHYCNLWNYNVNKNGTNLVGLNVVDYNGLTHGKTVYDPCPIGYTIPTPYEIANLATFKTSTYLNGYNLYDTNPGTWTSTGTMVGYKINGNFWPANGMRMYLSDNTHVANVGSYGYWFSSGPFNSHMVLALLEYTPGHPYGTSTVGFTIDGGYAKASARSIRCVPE